MQVQNYNKNFINKNSFYSQKSPQIQPNFTSNTGEMDSSLNSSASRISTPCKKALELVNRKDYAGYRKLVEQFPNIMIKRRSFMMKHLNENDDAVTIGFPQRSNDVFRIALTSKKSADGTANEKEFLIKNGKLVKSMSGSDIIYMDKKELGNSGLSDVFDKYSDEIDYRLLQVKKYLISEINNDNIPEDGLLGYSLTDKLSKMEDKYNQIDEVLSTMNPIAITKKKASFGDYRMKAAQYYHEFINVGSDKNNVVFAPLRTEKKEGLTRLIISDKDGNLIDTYLIQNSNKIVSNVNKNNPNSIPDKLLFYSKDELKNDVLPSFVPYVEMASEKLNDFYSHLTKVEPVQDVHLKNENKEMLDKTFKCVLGVMEIFSKHSYIDATNMKKSYNEKIDSPKFELEAGRSAMVLADINEVHDKVAFLKVSNKKYPNLSRISVFSKDNELKKMFLLDGNDKIVSNYNTEYPAVIPKNLKY